MTSKEKIKFRQSKKWKNFRLQFINFKDLTCELCGTVYKGKRCKMLQLHHLDPDNYTDLDRNKFKLICAPCHDLIERMTIKLSWGDRAKEWAELLKDFIPKQGGVK